MLKTERRALIDLITAQRKRLGMTQAELAEAAGVARKTVNNMEAGRTDGQDATVARMARAVGLDRELGVTAEVVHAFTRACLSRAA